LTEVNQHTEVAVRLLGAADALRQETGLTLSPTAQERYEYVSATLRQLFGDERFETLSHAGKTTPLAEIVAETRSLSLT
jgi:hypothetical protein